MEHSAQQAPNCGCLAANASNIVIVAILYPSNVYLCSEKKRIFTLESEYISANSVHAQREASEV